MDKEKYVENHLKRLEVEKAEDLRGWIEKIPTLNFNSKWNVKVIPPFSGVLARFIVDYNGNNVSVYLDVNNSLGYMDGPYWEIHPAFDNNNNQRFMIHETNELLEAINKSLNDREEEK